YTVLTAAGARTDRAQFSAFCTDQPEGAACDAIGQLGIGSPEVSDADLGQDVTEARIKAIVALDPGGVPAMTVESLKAIMVPTLIIGAGRTPEILNPDHEAAFAAQIVPGAEYALMPEAGHFDFLGPCTDMAVDILRSENPRDAIICEGDKAVRLAVHEATADRVIAFLNAQ
ncbi:MAG: alpha/beta hydrolase family protein, partial [Pikeienuella sp.]